ncbi:hypothetical protein [Lacticaseibacillus saniviri]|uniref:Uncharacterized protein n=1 Tax=Lacticaseibacillus saniviri JCM 17471 = DSM 24301 TaxID=1293598 RepID=A0A0R2MSK7_9LACO|nr:hypothetical protein [Lacticaseibacillus saniviri]KRO16561.1 hypothetical protein IV56_GL001003 [Lacticaseibacillus saniviri JCM 17471 = DSM 24301]MCG4281019.1 hypothetical protein [Lacticaseibacillus saniviri]
MNTIFLNQKRAAFTLIEVIVSLGIWLAVLVLWPPLLRQVQARFPDQAILAYLTADRRLNQLANTATLTRNEQQLQVKQAKETYLVATYVKTGNHPMIRVTTPKGGHLPLLNDVTSFTLIATQGANQQRYQLVMTNQQHFDGVVIGARDGH